MGWKVPVASGNGDGEPREVCPADQYPAVLVAIIDLGSQEKKEFGGTDTVLKRMVACVWEVQGEAQTSEGEPFYFAEEYTLSLHEKAKFRAVLEMGGLKIADDGDCDIEAALGQPYRLDIEVHQSAKGNEYSRIGKGGVGKCPPSMRKAIKKPTRDMLVWQIEQGKMPKHDWLPYLYGKPIPDVQAKAQELAGKPAGKAEPVTAAAGRSPAQDDDFPF